MRCYIGNHCSKTPIFSLWWGVLGLLFHNLNTTLSPINHVITYFVCTGPFYYRSKISKSRIFLQVLGIDAVPIVICGLIPIFWHGDIDEDELCNMTDIFTYGYMAYVLLPGYILVGNSIICTMWQNKREYFSCINSFLKLFFYGKILSRSF